MSARQTRASSKKANGAGAAPPPVLTPPANNNTRHSNANTSDGGSSTPSTPEEVQTPDHITAPKEALKVSPLKMPSVTGMHGLPVAPGTPGTPGSHPGPMPVPQTPTMLPPPSNPAAFEVDMPHELLQQGKPLFPLSLIHI